MKLQLLAASAAAALIASPAVAQPEEGRWAVSVEAGPDFPIDGELFGGRHVEVPELGSTGSSARLTIDPQDYDGVYGTSWGGGVEVDYGLSDRDEVFGTLRYMKADGGQNIVGRAFVNDTGQTFPIIGEFGDREVWTGDVGYRRYFGEGRLRPYAAARVGAAYTSGIDGVFSIPEAGVAPTNASLYDDSWSWTVGGDIGVDYAVTDNFTLQAETGLRYISDLSNGDDTGLSQLGLGELTADSGSSLSMPVMVRGRWVF